MSDVTIRSEDIEEIQKLLKDRTLEGLGLIGRIEALRETLEECADELEGWVEAYYQDSLRYPSERRRYNRDMGAVLRARKLLNE